MNAEPVHWEERMPSESLPNEEDACELEVAMDHGNIAACSGNLRATIGALIVAEQLS